MTTSIINIQCLTTACEELSIPFRFIDKYNNCVQVGLSRPCYFVNAATPFNTDSVSRICCDKEFCHLLLEGIVKMPKTTGYLDPGYKGYQSKRYRSATTISTIIEQAEKDYSYPVIAKMNSGSRSTHVYSCSTKEELARSLTKIFNQKSKDYDFVALIQEKIMIKKEYRVIVYNEKIAMAYTKGTFEMVDDMTLKKIEDFIRPIFQALPITFAGLDIILDLNDDLYLLEINENPGFGQTLFTKYKREIVSMYKMMLFELIRKSDTV